MLLRQMTPLKSDLCWPCLAEHAVPPVRTVLRVGGHCSGWWPACGRSVSAEHNIPEGDKPRPALDMQITQLAFDKRRLGLETACLWKALSSLCTPMSPFTQVLQKILKLVKIRTSGPDYWELPTNGAQIWPGLGMTKYTHCEIYIYI